MKAAMHTPQASEPKRALPRSLRLRLILWYGSLIAVALGVFALLFLLLTTDAINQSVTRAARTERRAAGREVARRCRCNCAFVTYAPPALWCRHTGGNTDSKLDHRDTRAKPSFGTHGDGKIHCLLHRPWHTHWQLEPARTSTS